MTARAIPMPLKPRGTRLKGSAAPVAGWRLMMLRAAMREDKITAREDEKESMLYIVVECSICFRGDAGRDCLLFYLVEDLAFISYLVLTPCSMLL